MSVINGHCSNGESVELEERSPPEDFSLDSTNHAWDGH